MRTRPAHTYCLAAAVGCVDSLISGRRARSVRSTPTRVTDACRLDPSASTSVRPPAVSCVCGLFRASLPRSDTTSSQPGAPPDAERMRGDARPRRWSGGTGMTSQLTDRTRRLKDAAR
ncbi:hypothetical protein EVAR_35489_1 [Eumeta japonica]|uniref:Uncharacterized protein n=1 Tax=Eumeta variegata TaxID=151549 RepID=A0A4C1X4R1_EUMVA|nr:hypothetical protein EVAR_35489_1 [Eumeta japonica]